MPSRKGPKEEPAVLVRLIHWNLQEAKVVAAGVQTTGLTVDSAPFTQENVRELARHPPRAIVVDLSRLPSQGRDVAANLLQYKSLRSIPFIFVDGDPEKVDRVKRLFPSAAYTNTAGLAGSLRREMARTPREIMHSSTSAFQAYASVPLAKKLGLKEGSRARLVGAPRGFEKLLGSLPTRATVTRRKISDPSLLLWFVKRQMEIERGIASVVESVGPGRLWIIWPKKSGDSGTDLSQALIRSAGLARGLVDYKVCSIDRTWSGLLFKKRNSRQE